MKNSGTTTSSTTSNIFQLDNTTTTSSPTSSKKLRAAIEEVDVIAVWTMLLSVVILDKISPVQAFSNQPAGKLIAFTEPFVNEVSKSAPHAQWYTNEKHQRQYCQRDSTTMQYQVGQDHGKKLFTCAMMSTVHGLCVLKSRFPIKYVILVNN